jgi:hypothetical protein
VLNVNRRLRESDAVRATGLAVSRFLGFFFALTLTLAVVVTAYSIVAGAPISQIWDGIKALIISAVVLLIFTILAALIAGTFEPLDVGESDSAG